MASSVTRSSPSKILAMASTPNMNRTKSTQIHVEPVHHLHKEQQVAKLVEICEELDTEEHGYVTTGVLAKILRGIPGVRPEISGDGGSVLN